MELDRLACQARTAPVKPTIFKSWLKTLNHHHNDTDRGRSIPRPMLKPVDGTIQNLLIVSEQFIKLLSLTTDYTELRPVTMM